jgi:tripartite-type tricarboxylate transporter receptor subunit TctC
VLGVALASLAAHAQAQPARYPNRTIEVVVAYGAGGSTDLVARTLAQKFQDRLGQSVVVLNKPGGSGTIGATLAARAPPDGYTLYVGYTSEVVVVPQVSKSVKYSIDDFEPIAVTGLVPLVLVTSKNMRATSVAELIAGGGAQAVADVIGGHIDLFFAGLAAAKAAIDSGSVKPLAVTGNTRSSALPNVPTFKEAGVKDFELASWNVMLAPKGTPPDILAFLRQETAVALNDPRVREILAAQGVEASSTQDVRAFLAHERAAFGRAVRDLGITID